MSGSRGCGEGLLTQLGLMEETCVETMCGMSVKTWARVEELSQSSAKGAVRLQRSGMGQNDHLGDELSTVLCELCSLGSLTGKFYMDNCIFHALAWEEGY